MAKKKASRIGRPPSGKPTPQIVVSIRGTQDWAAFVDRFAKERGVDKSSLVEEALRFYSSHLRRKDVPPDRK